MVDEDLNKQEPLSRISAIVAKGKLTASSNMCANMREKRIYRTIVYFISEHVCSSAVSYLGSLRRTGSACAKWLWYEYKRARVGNLLVCYVFAPVALGLGLVVICE